MQNVKIVVYGLVSRSESCPTEFGSQCVWISHGDRLTFGAIEYLKKKPTCPDGGAVTAREEADAVLCSKDKPLQQTVVAMEHVPRHRVLVVLTAAGVGGVGEAGVDGDDKVPDFIEPTGHHIIALDQQIGRLHRHHKHSGCVGWSGIYLLSRTRGIMLV